MLFCKSPLCVEWNATVTTSVVQSPAHRQTFLLHKQTLVMPGIMHIQLNPCMLWPFVLVVLYLDAEVSLSSLIFV